MDGALLTDADLGLSYPPSMGGAEPGAMPGEITVHPSPRASIAPMPATSTGPSGAALANPALASAAAQEFAPGGQTGAPPPQPATPHGLLSDADLGIEPHHDGVLSNSADDGWVSGAAKGTGTAAVKAVGNSAGFVGGLGNFADYLMARAEHAITGKPVETILDELAKQKKQVQAEAGLPAALDARNVLPAPDDVSKPILKRTGEYVPTSEPGKLAQAGTEAALSMFGPGAGSRVGTLGEVARGAIAAAPATFAGGAIGQGVTDVTGDPLLGAAGGIIGGGAVQGGAAAVKKLAAPAVMGIPGIDRVPIVGPRVADARDSAAASALLSKAEKPQEFRDWAAQPSQSPEVLGSPRTTATTVDDRGLYQAEKDARNVDNAPFNAADRAQSQAQQDTIRSIQSDGDVFRPGQMVRDRLNAIDAAAQEAESRLNAAHQAAVEGRAAADQEAHGRMASAFQDAHDRAAQAADNAALPLRQLPAPEVTGETLRTAQQSATDAAKAARDELYRAVDPDGTLATVVTPLKEAKDRIAAAIDPHAGVEPAGAEAKLWSDIDRLPDVIPFKSLQKLDSRVTAAMADARRNPNPNDPEAISRLTQLKSATMDAIHNGVENQAAHEARLVERGVLAPENTVDARTRDVVQGFFERQQQARLAAGQGRADGVGGASSGSNAGLRRATGAGSERPGAGSLGEGTPPPTGRGADQPQIGGNLGYTAPALGDRTVSARMHAPETAAALGQDVPGTVVRAYGGPLDRAVSAGQPGLIGYHGSPHDFERFSSSHIGSGEGNQAYGHGLYFAENEGVARGYRDQLSKRDADVRLNNQGFRRDQLLGDVRDAFDHVKESGGKIDAAIQEAKDASSKKMQAGDMEGADFWMRRATTLEDMKDRGFAMGGEGHLYQVKVNRPSNHFLDWDKPLSEQSAYVQKALARPEIQEAIQQHLSGIGRAIAPETYSGANLYAGMSAKIPGRGGAFDMSAPAQKLRDAGIAGIRYLDAGSRHADAAKPSHNLVTFNDHDIVVTHKNGVELARPVALPQMLMGQARGAFVKELTAAGMNPDWFSKDLRVRADKLLKPGMHLDHGVAFERAAKDEAINDGTYARAAQTYGGDLPAASRGGASAARGVPDESQGLRRPSEAGGAPSQNLTPNIDAGAQNRLNAAKAAHAAYVQTFKNPTVRGALETNGFAGQYKTPASAIPAKWVVPGDKGYETARAYLAASNNDPRAVAAMQDASLAMLRKNMPPIGSLHPNALARWKETFAGANRALDEASPGFSSRFDNAADATQALLDLGAQQKQQLADFQKAAAARSIEANQASAASAREGVSRAKAIVQEAHASPAGKFAGQGGDRIAPAEVENAVGAMMKTGKEGATKMRSLIGSVSSDPDALAGLRKAGVDWMIRSFSNADGGMSGAAFVKFYRDNRDVLSELYGVPHTNMIGAVASDIEANARWRTVTAIKGGSDTAKNLKPMLEKAVDDTKRHISIGAAATAGFLAGGPKGAAGGAGLYLLNSLRSAGIRSVQDLYREALLDPEKARYLISKMPSVPEGGKLRALTGSLRKSLIVGEQQTSQQPTVH